MLSGSNVTHASPLSTDLLLKYSKKRKKINLNIICIFVQISHNKLYFPGSINNSCHLVSDFKLNNSFIVFAQKSEIEFKQKKI